MLHVYADCCNLFIGFVILKAPVRFSAELGGYLGLLLGASVVTVCELVDMIIFQIIIKKWQNVSFIK